MTRNSSSPGITVFCRSECCPLMGAMVRLCSESGRLLAQGVTNGSGIVFFPVCSAGVYSVQVCAGCRHVPEVQCACVRLRACQSARLNFGFTTRPGPANLGTLTIQLADASYPQLPLEGEYTLWLGSK